MQWKYISWCPYGRPFINEDESSFRNFANEYVRWSLSYGSVLYLFPLIIALVPRNNHYFSILICVMFVYLGVIITASYAGSLWQRYGNGRGERDQPPFWPLG
jgi:hypothetical protein